MKGCLKVFLVFVAVFLLVILVVSVVLLPMTTQLTESPPTPTPTVVRLWPQQPTRQPTEPVQATPTSPHATDTPVFDLTATAAPLSDPTQQPPKPLPPVQIGFVSGGLGLSQAEWEKRHVLTGKDVFGSIYDGEYIVAFQVGNVWYIERQWTAENAVMPEVVEADNRTLIPNDSQLVNTYSPEGRPETVVNLYFSESLKDRFRSEDSLTGDWWVGGQPGNFAVQYNLYDFGVTRMIIAIGNNP
jgi:hypothetical protein